MICIKLWIDDVRPAPDPIEYIRCLSVNAAKMMIIGYEGNGIEIELIDLDYDAGDYASHGGDYIRLLDWLEKTGRNYPIRLHSMNPVGIQNMRRIIKRNGWKEIK